MRRAPTFSLAAGLLLVQAGTASAIDIEQIRPNAWAATQLEARMFNDCNSLIVEADEFVIIVDAQESRDDVHQIINFTRDRIGKPVRYLVNTHWHSDHTQGNTLYRQTFGDDLVIVGHTTHEEDIFGRAAKDGVVFTGPSETVADAWSVDAAVASFSVVPMRGHTRGDLVVSFGNIGVVATGDLVDAMPYAGHGYPLEWLDALKAIQRLGATTYVPGHGPTLHDDLLISKLLTYFNALTSQVASLYAAGKTQAEIKAAVDLSRSREMLVGDSEAAGRFFDQVQEQAIERAIAELEQSPR